MDFDGTKSLTPGQWVEIDRDLRSGNRAGAVSKYRKLTGAPPDKALEMVTIREKGLSRGGGKGGSGMDFF